jgi:hypothetical protein
MKASRLGTRVLIICACVAGASLNAGAQTDPTPPGTIEDNKPAQKDDSNPKADNTKPLSEKLKENEGIIKPPPTGDPEIRKPPPDTTGDKMPVIIPPGEPGGDQSVQPK